MKRGRNLRNSYHDEISRINRRRDEHIFIFFNYRVIELKHKARAFFELGATRVFEQPQF